MSKTKEMSLYVAVFVLCSACLYLGSSLLEVKVAHSPSVEVAANPLEQPDLPDLPMGVEMVEVTDRPVVRLRDRNGLEIEAYVTGDGRWVLGHAVTTPTDRLAAQVAPSQPRVDGSANEAAMPEDTFWSITQSEWIEFGEGDKVLYVFFDMRCPGCAQFHRDIQPLIASGDLGVRVRYIPVAVTGPESLALAQHVLAPRTEQARKEQLLALHKTGTPPITTPLPEDLLKIGLEDAQVNFAVLMKTGQPATPAFAYQSADGPVSVVGMTAQGFDAMLKDIAPEASSAESD